MRITKKDREEYAELVKKSRQKIRNTVKKFGPIIHDLERHVDKTTKEVTYEVVQKDIRKDLDIPSIESFTNRKDFNAWKEQQQKFTSRNNPHSKYFKNQHGDVFTDYTKIVLENKHNRAEKVRKAELKKLESMGLKESLEQHAWMMQRPKFSELKKNLLDFNYLRGKQAIEGKLEGLTVKGSPQDYQRKRETMIENFIHLIRETTNSDGDNLVNLLYQLSPDEFYALYIHQDTDWDFEAYYLALEDQETHAHIIAEITSDIVKFKGSEFQEQVDMLKDF